MAGGNPPRAGIRNQHWRAIGTADPKTLAALIADQAVGFRPGFGEGLMGAKHPIAMDLLGAVDTHPGTQIAGQYLRSSAIPLTGEKPMFKVRQEIGLEVIAPVTANPGPSRQAVEVHVRSVKGGG
jgi:hypothetical protein